VATPDRLPGGLRLRILDLLEHLAHAGAQQVARLRVGVAIAASGARGLARVEVVGWSSIVVRHREIVALRRGGVNRPRRQSTAAFNRRFPAVNG
jgi:hypothetical protein